MAAAFTFYEFFSGGGMARAGLGDRWRCLRANDIDAKKAAAYRANFGGDDLIESDVAALGLADLPGRADLAWASFPCQDLSVAGRGGGLEAGRSGAFWPFWRLMQGLRSEGRAPSVIVIENVCGLLSSRGGRDMTALADAFAVEGYRLGARVIDAASFTPQSRPRLFIIGVADHVFAPSVLLAKPGADGPVAAPEEGRGRGAWLRWALPEPPRRNLNLIDILEPADAVRWDAPEATEKLLSLMGPRHREKLDAARDEARRRGAPVAGTAFRRTRVDGSRVEARFDGLAGCLRTPAGGSSRQVLLVAEPDGAVRSRLLTGREAARLMGLPDSYVIPSRANDALKLFGDGVAPPAVRHLADHLLEPLVQAARARSAA